MIELAIAAKIFIAKACGAAAAARVGQIQPVRDIRLTETDIGPPLSAVLEAAEDWHQATLSALKSELERAHRAIAQLTAQLEYIDARIDRAPTEPTIAEIARRDLIDREHPAFDGETYEAEPDLVPR